MNFSSEKLRMENKIGLVKKENKFSQNHNLVDLAIPSRLLARTQVNNQQSELRTQIFWTVYCFTKIFINMSCIQQMDELVKEYLIFRGFTGTVRSFDVDLKSDKDKAFRVSVGLYIYIHIIYILYL